MFARVTGSLLFLSLCALPLTAHAGEGNFGSVDESAEPAIYNGTEVETCAWPNVVAVQTSGSLCTGTLVHPQLILYAAHCGATPSTKIRFGEDTNTASTVTPEFCETNPGYLGTADQAHDWAFCKLAEPIDLPVTPIVFGCETSALYPGAEVAIVGFGNNTSNDTGAGTKRWSFTTTSGINEGSNVGQLGGGGQASVCSGDSGGPAFVRFPDGSWHAWGIASTVSGGCGGVGTHSLMQGAIPWVEELTNLDLTPCHDSDGTWNPSGLCTGFYGAEAGAAFGDWGGGDWCQGTPLTGSSDTCGGPFDEIPDDIPPTVAITYPMNGQVFAEDPAAFTIEIDAADVGWGVKEVRMEIDGNDIGVSDTVAPYAFGGASFPAGSYTLVAVAEDYAGLVTKSEPAAIGVGGQEPPDVPDGDGDGETGSGTDGGASVGTGTGPGLDDEEGSSEGCACRAQGGEGGWAALGLIGLIGIVRRRPS